MVNVWTERKRAILDVEGEGVDVQATGADHANGVGISNFARVKHVNVRNRWSRVLVHTAWEGRQ